jgi:hypothetical protein
MVWCTTVRACRGSSRRPRGPSSSAAPDSVVGQCRAGRRASHAVSAAEAGFPNGTVRCLLPLPSTVTRCRAGVDVIDVESAQLADPDSGGVKQSRRSAGHAAPSGSPCSAPRSAACMAATSLVLRAAPTAGCDALPGTCSRVAGSASSRPRRHGPCGEGLGRRRTSRQRGSRRTVGGLCCQPCPSTGRDSAVEPGAGRPLARERRTASAGRSGRRGGCVRSGHVRAARCSAYSSRITPYCSAWNPPSHGGRRPNAGAHWCRVSRRGCFPVPGAHVMLFNSIWAPGSRPSQSWPRRPHWW